MRARHRLRFSAFGRPLWLVPWYDATLTRPYCGAEMAVTLFRDSLHRVDGPGFLEMARFAREACIGGIASHREVEDHLCDEILHGRLVIVDQPPDGGRDEQADPLGAALTRVRRACGDSFHVGGSSYRLIFVDQLEEMRDRGSFVVVRLQAAREVLRLLARSPKAKTVPEATWTTLDAGLAHPQEKPRADGVVLLRDVPRYTTQSSSEDAMTPAQLRAWAEAQRKKDLGTIAVRLIAVDGTPIADREVEVEDGTGVVHKGRLDRDGRASFEGVARERVAEIRFPGLTSARDEDWPHARRDREGRLVVVPKSAHVAGTPDTENLCCLYRPLMTIAFALPDASDVEHPIYTLTSDDGRYERTRRPKDDLVPGDGLLQLEFEELVQDTRYTLVREEADGQQEVLFSDLSFLQIVDQPRGDPFRRDAEPVAAEALASFEGEASWEHQAEPADEERWA